MCSESCTWSHIPNTEDHALCIKFLVLTCHPEINIWILFILTHLSFGFACLLVGTLQNGVLIHESCAWCVCTVHLNGGCSKWIRGMLIMTHGWHSFHMLKPAASRSCPLSHNTDDSFSWPCLRNTFFFPIHKHNTTTAMNGDIMCNSRLLPNAGQDGKSRR